MEVKAQAKYIRTSPRKARLVIDLIRGMDVERALDYLGFVNKSVVKPITNLLNSVIANAENNYKLKRENLYIKKIAIDGGPTLKRWQPRAFGRATPIRRRSAHITIVLDERLKRESKFVTPKIKEREKTKVVPQEEIKKVENGKKSSPLVLRKMRKLDTTASKDIEKKKGFVKRFFNRKTA